MIGVTGTNGKTTTTYLCKAVLASAKRSNPLEADRFFLELLAESRGHHFGIEMSGTAPDRVRSSIGDREFLVDVRDHGGGRLCRGAAHDPRRNRERAKELAALQARVRPGRAALRYFDQVEWDA